MRSRVALMLASCAVWAATGCKYPYPPDLVDEDAPAGRSLGGTVDGLWAGGAVTLHLAAGDASEDLAAGATEPFTFTSRLMDGTSYLVTVVDDGPDHDCAVTNGSGRVMGADITDLAVTCTSLIPHSIAISTAVPFTFDPRVTRYSLPVSVLQQEVRVTVTGTTLTSATVAGQPVTIGQASAPIPLEQGETTVAVEVTKGPLSRRYDLAFDRGATPIVEALRARAFNAGAGDAFGAALAVSEDYVAIGAPLEDSSNENGNDDAAMDAGAVYIYRRTGQTWTYSQFLKGSPITARRKFGAALAMDGDLLVVGAPITSPAVAQPGAAYVFHLDRATGLWQQDQRIAAAQVQNRDFFGFSVAVSGDVIVVGSPERDLVPGSFDKIGSVHTFRRSGGLWIEDAVLRPPPGQDRLAQFGSRVALDGDALAVNQFIPADKDYVYRRSGTNWVQENLPPSASGPAIALRGGALAIGQPGNSPGGAIRVFTRSGASWDESGLLKAGNPTAGAEIGYGLAIRGNVVVTAATPTHMLQVFDQVGGTWIPVPPLAPSGPPADDPSFPTFGTATALSGYGTAVGAYADGGPGNTVPGSGTVWLFR